MSLRNSGICIYDLREKFDLLQFAGAYKSVAESGLDKFNTLECNAADSFNLTNELILIIEEWSPDILILEMPDFSQSQKSAIAIGMLWGAIMRLFPLFSDASNIFTIEPTCLKAWSQSKKGDAKEKVKEKVIERVHLTKRQVGNHNIVDAVGLALMFVDMVNNDY